MSIEGPFLTALIARLAEPEFNLAAYGVAFAFALMIEAPVIMMLSASTAMVKTRISFFKLKNFSLAINVAATIIIFLISIPQIFSFIGIDLLGLPGKISLLTNMALLILIPWPAAIGYRRFYQGILIRNNLTKRVAYGTFVRLCAMASAAVILFFSKIEGVIVGAAALSVGVVAEAIATRFMASAIVKKVSANFENEEITYMEIWKFYFPLAMMAFISLGIHPAVTYFVGQAKMPIESLALLPVLNSLVFIFRSIGLSYQEVALALMKNYHDYKILKNFAFGLAFIAVAMLAVISLTPLSEIWLIKVSGLSPEIASIGITPLMLYTIFPALTVLIGFQRSILMCEKKTTPISTATIIEVGLMCLVLIWTIHFTDFVGITAAVIGYTLGRIGANIYLQFPFNSVKKEIILKG